MDKYFNIKFNFEHEKLEQLIKNTAIKDKGYFCFVDLNSLVYSYKEIRFQNVLNESLSNSCDGSYIALMASRIHKKKLKEYIGPDFFKKFIYYRSQHLIVGNTEDVFSKIKLKVAKINGNADNLNYLPVPFLGVEDFNYKKIGDSINILNPDYIWVSLGAPKQEFFMSKLLPYIDRGVLLGVGAALNYFSGEIKDIPQWTKKLHIIWLYRLFTEPKKQFKRLRLILLNFPKMIEEEKRRTRNSN